MMVYLETAIDIALMAAVYFGSAWLMGYDVKGSEFALCVAAYALLQANKGRAA